MLDSIKELNEMSELFKDSQRTKSVNAGPYLHIIDDFYDNPDAIRVLALKQEFLQYTPPLEAQVGKELASEYPKDAPLWLSSSLFRNRGKVVNNPKPGFRYAVPELIEKLESIVNEKINKESWPETGDWWNGAFHLQYKGNIEYSRSIHHHFKKGDVYPRGWSGLVYLSPNAPTVSGTTIWRNKKTGLCIASAGVKFSKKVDDFELIYRVENRYNRLVLFRENVLHRAESGFGNTKNTGRLSQTFFFHSEVGGL